MKAEGPMKVFIQEDDIELRTKIVQELKTYNYQISFFSKKESMFDLMNFNPDILIQDYAQNKMIKCYELVK